MHVHQTTGNLALPRHRPCPRHPLYSDSSPTALPLGDDAPSSPQHSARGSLCPQGKFSSCSTAGRAREASCPQHHAAHGWAAPREGQHQPRLSSATSPPRHRLHCEEQKAFKGLGSARSCWTNIVALVSN